MPNLRFLPEDSILLVVDVQPSFMAGIWEADRVVQRSQFLAQVARLLDIPVLATEQNPSRMGSTDPALKPLTDGIYEKMAFSCAGCSELMERLDSQSRKTVVLVGIETHICVTQTALDLQERGFAGGVCPDAVSARTVERHKLGMERIRDSGVMPVHSEALAYEWVKTADHPHFREMLKLVKEFA